MAAPRETDGAGWLESIAFFTREKARTKAIAERVQEAIFYLGKLAESRPIWFLESKACLLMMKLAF